MSIIKGTNQIVAGFGGTKRSIGEVYFSQSALATDNSGALPLFTGETIASANTIYPEFYNWILAHTELQCTSAEYESALSTYGECAKYVIGKIGDNATAPDYGTTTIAAGSLRLPLIRNYIKAANPSEGIKNIEAGLPNIDSDTNWVNVTSGTETTATNTNVLSDKGAFGGTNSQGGHGISGNNYPINWRRFDASRSSAVYGKSSTVTPASTTLYPWVVAYTAAIPASTAQAAEFQQGLSGKADTNLGNVPSNYDYVVESYNEGTNWYRVYKSGWIEQGGRITMTDSTNQTVSFLKAMFDTNYTWNIHGIRTGGHDNFAWQCGIYSTYTTTSMQIRNSSNGTMTICWEVKGQGAE